MILQQPIAREQMTKLLATGATDLLEGFVSNKTRRKFKARLAWDAKEGKVVFAFEPRPGRPPAKRPGGGAAAAKPAPAKKAAAETAAAETPAAKKAPAKTAARKVAAKNDTAKKTAPKKSGVSGESRETPSGRSRRSE